jgi:hypothetical protein
MSDQPPPDPADDELAAELENLAAEPLHLEAVERETGRPVEGVVSRDHLAAALRERDELR